MVHAACVRWERAAVARAWRQWIAYTMGARAGRVLAGMSSEVVELSAELARLRGEAAEKRALRRRSDRHRGMGVLRPVERVVFFFFFLSRKFSLLFCDSFVCITPIFVCTNPHTSDCNMCLIFIKC